MSDPDGISPERIERLKLNFLEAITEGPEALTPDLLAEAIELLSAQAATIAQLRQALTELVERYTELINSGDCGFWDPEKEHQVKAAREALRNAGT